MKGKTNYPYKEEAIYWIEVVIKDDSGSSHLKPYKYISADTKLDFLKEKFNELKLKLDKEI